MNAAHGALLSCAALAAMYLPAVLLGSARDDEPDATALAAQMTTAPVAPATPAFAPPFAPAPADPAPPAAGARREEALPVAPDPTPEGGAQAATATAAASAPTDAIVRAAMAPPATAVTASPGTMASPAPSVPLPLEENQLVVFYGTPLHAGLGILGMFDADEAARRVRAQASVYDDINGDRGARGALDLIYGLAQAEPTSNALYVRYLKDTTVQRYIDVAERHDIELILDLQIGRGDILEEVRKIERFLLHPRVHVAIDPEYAVGPHGEPIKTPGRISGYQMNDVQRYIDDLVRAHNLPPKMVIIHQYMNATVTDGDVALGHANVELVLNMDAFGKTQEKIERYHQFASRPYARRDGFNIFLKQDERVMSEQEVLDITPMPDVIFYQ